MEYHSIRNKIYLDYNASTPIDPAVKAAMLPFMEQYFGNPGNSHWAAVPAKKAYEQARLQVAQLLGCEADEIVFTSGGSEANNHVLKGVFFSLRDKGNHIITTEIEHPAILNPCQHLERLGAEITYLPVDSYGRVHPADVEKAIKSNTILVTVMHANNEVGTIQPIDQISEITRKKQVLFHTDAAQSVGKISTRVDRLGVDFLSVAGHKLYAPKGIGALYIRKGIQLEPLIHGAGHEAGRRAGTENIMLAIGLGKAALMAKEELACRDYVTQLRDYFWTGLCRLFPEQVTLNGHPQHRLPNTLNVSFSFDTGANILKALPEIAASTGAACHAEHIELSQVLKAMQVPPEIGKGTIRFSLGRFSTKDEIEETLTLLNRFC
jgi:cysteine desulfurase